MEKPLLDKVRMPGYEKERITKRQAKRISYAAYKHWVGRNNVRIIADSLQQKARRLAYRIFNKS